ncbi:MAG TPA: sterol desaturase family protein [Holophagaceae bacterium]|nr:sterol desaturase family protein [Holophagaceae bacterium]
MSVELLSLTLVLGTYFTCAGLDRLRPARSFPRPRGWTWMGLAFLLSFLALNALIPALLSPAWIARHALLPGHRLGTWGGVIVGFLVETFIGYFLHRAFHRVPFLWRWFHQLHHSSERIDTLATAVAHPFDVSLGIALGLVIRLGLLGLTPEAAIWTGTLTGLAFIFQHVNLATPQWVGILILRPEAHCIHHERNIHAFNYSEFPLWDVLFGTFRNPATWAGEAGFGPERSQRLGAMLLGRDVTLPEGGA